jgi:sigma-B regulation protein RsbU (phosphoserine phosphatase)
MAVVREVIALWLRSRGFNVVEAADGREAVELAPQVHPDVILMDLGMPGLDGLEATRRIHELEGTRDVAVVAVTAFTDAYARRRVEEVGNVGHMSKPVHFEALDRVIQKHLHTR